MKKPLILALTLLLFWGGQAYCSENQPSVTLNEAKWPYVTTTETKSTLKFVFLNLNLPEKYLKNIEIFNFSIPSVALSFNDSGNKNIFISLKSEKNGFSELYRKINVDNIHDFFKRIGTPDIKNTNLTKIRNIYGLDTANSYNHFRRNDIDAYFIESENIENSSLFILISGESQIYEIGGSLDKDLVNIILSNLSI